jgi:CDP-glucose 4,6-dehydratase
MENMEIDLYMDKKFWGNKKVLITGFEGFLGSNLTKHLLLSGANIVGLDIKTGRRDTILSKGDHKKMIVVKGSVCDYSLVKKLLDRHSISIVFHLAAEAIVGECLKQPACAFSSNIQGTWNVLEACRHSPLVKAIIIASSDKAYGSHDDLPYNEETPLRGKHPYDVSKSCADLIAHAYHNTYGSPVAITRCGNIYGPGDYNFSRILPEAFRCAFSGKRLSIRSDGKFTRDYVYVDDIVSGYILLAEKLQKFNLSGEAFNFSYEKPMDVIGLVNTIYKLTGRDTNYAICNKAKYEIRHQYLSSKKARKMLGWKPLCGMDNGLKKTMKWYQEVLA